MTAALPPSIKLAARMGRFLPSASLTAGEPGFPTPDHLKQAATARIHAACKNLEM